MEAALRVALDRHGMSVETAPTAAVVEAVTAAAPDLVVLLGDAVVDGGLPVLRHLAENPTTSVVPVTLLSNDTSLDQRLRAFRSGAVAVVQRIASADAIARQIAQLARELPERPGQSTGELGEATLEELVELVSRELRSGILSVEPQAGRRDPVRVVLGAGGPVADALQDFVARLKPLIAKAEPLRYELLEESGGRLRLFDSDGAETADLDMLRDLRVLVMDNDPGRADVLAQALRDHGSLVGVTDISETGLARVQALDPEVVILDSAAIEGPGFEAVRTLRRDPRSRWASLLVARWDELWPEGAATPDLEQLAGRIAPLTEHDRTLRARAQAEDGFDTRLELTGPSRLLRTLVRIPGMRHVVVRATRATIEVDLADGLVVGAQGTAHVDSPRPIEGMAALAALLNLSAGRIHIGRCGHPSVANVMLPVDEALARAAKEDSPVKPSVMPPTKKAPPIRPPGAYGPALRATGAGTSAKPELNAPPTERSLRAGGSPFPPADALRSAPPHASADDEGSPIDSDSIGFPVERGAATARSAGGARIAATSSDLRWEDSSADKRVGDAPTARPPSGDGPIEPPVDALPPMPRPLTGTPTPAKSRYVPPPPPAKRAATATGQPSPNPASVRKKTMLGVAPVVPSPRSPEAAVVSTPPLADSQRGRKRSSTLLGAGAASQPAPPGPAHVDRPHGRAPSAAAAPGPGRARGLPPVLADEDPARPHASLRPPTAGAREEKPFDPFADLEATSPSVPALVEDSGEAPLLDPEELSGLMSLPPEAGPPPSPELERVDPTAPIPLQRDSTDLSNTDFLPAGSLPPAALVPTKPRVAVETKSRVPRRLAFVALGMTCSAIAGGSLAFFTRPGAASGEGRVVASAAAAPVHHEGASPPPAPPAREPARPSTPDPERAVASAAEPPAAPTAAPEPPAVTEVAPPAPEPTAAPEPAPAAPATAPGPTASSASGAPAFTPDSELPRDRARASDVLVADAIELLAADRLDVAEQALTRAMELDRNNPQGFEALARLHLRRRSFDAAIDFAEQAVRVRRRRGEYYVLLGDCLLAAGRADEARDAWRRGLRADASRELRARLSANPEP